MGRLLEAGWFRSAEVTAYRAAMLDVMRQADQLDGEALERSAALTRAMQERVIGRIQAERSKATQTRDGEESWNPFWLHRLVGAVEEVTREQAEHAPEQAGEHSCDYRDRERDACAIDQAREDVASETVGAERKAVLTAEPRGRQQCVDQVLLERIVRRQPLRERSECDDREQDCTSEQHARVAADRLRELRAHPCRSLGLSSAYVMSTSKLVTMKITAKVSTNP